MKSVLLWEPGQPWTDYSVQADIVISPQVRHGPDGVRGLVVRAMDKDNLCRLEVIRDGDRDLARLVKRVGGVETVLATDDKAPPQAALDWRENPSCRGWSTMDPAKAEVFFKDWRMDRLTVQIKGNVIKAQINGKEAFPGGVKDADLAAGGDLATGAAGLYAENPCCMDNVQVKAE